MTSRTSRVLGSVVAVMVTTLLATTPAAVGLAGTSSAATPGSIVNPEAPLGTVRLAVGPDGNVWATLFLDDAIGRVTPAGVVTRFQDPRINGAMGIAAGPDGNLWYANHGGGSIGRITPSGVITDYPDPTIEGPTSITAGPDGNLWFTNEGNDTIGRITTDGVVSSFTDATTSDPSSITVGPDGNLWYTNAGSIGRISPAGTITAFTAPMGAGSVITTGSDGDLWFTSNPGNVVETITPSGTITALSATLSDAPTAMLAAPGGGIWAATSDLTCTPTPGCPRASLQRVTPSGHTTTIHDPTIESPDDVVDGPDGDLWVSNLLGGIARISPDAPMAPENIRAVASSTAATVSWSPPEVGAPSIDRYVVTTVLTPPECGFIPCPRPADPTCVATAGATTCTIIGLNRDAHYQFDVQAFAGPVAGFTARSAPIVTAPFSDVAPLSSLGLIVAWMSDFGITTGYPDGTFRPAAPVTREAMATFLFRAAPENDSGNRPICTVAPFRDVVASSPFCGEIAWMKKRGLTTGYPDGSFHPGAAIERQATAAWLYRWIAASFVPASPTPTCTAAPFPDVAVGSPFCGEIAYVKSNGLATGYADGTFKPLQPTARDAASTFLWRLPSSIH